MEPLINNPGYQHIVEDIFLNLDQKEIFQCRLVKKSWKRFFQNQKRIFWLKKFQYPLHMASKIGDVNLVEFILENVNPPMYDQHGHQKWSC